MAVYGNILENYINLDLVYECNQFDYMVNSILEESINNVDIVLESKFNFNTIIEGIKKLWAKFMIWFREKLKWAKGIINKVLNRKPKEMNKNNGTKNDTSDSEKKEDKDNTNSNDDKKEDKDNTNSNDDKKEDKGYIEIKYTIYIYAKIQKIISPNSISSYIKYIRSNIPSIDKDTNISEYCKQYIDQVDEIANTMIDDIKGHMNLEKKSNTKKLNHLADLNYVLMDMEHENYNLESDIKLLNKKLDDYNTDISRYEDDVNKCIEEIKKSQNNIKDAKDGISKLKGKVREEYDKKVEDLKHKRTIYSDKDNLLDYNNPIGDKYRNLSDEDIHKRALKFTSDMRTSDKYLKNITRADLTLIKNNAIKLNLIKSDIVRFKKISTDIFDLTLCLTNALSQNKSVYDKVLYMYNTRELPKHDIELSVGSNKE